jgi:DNA mismatch repair protein MutL
MAIRILPQNLINQIAAGEVIESPASAAKELIENAIDAKATKIEIQAKSGGKTYLAISDNGVGMSKADLEKAIRRHATSKLETDDLLDINYFGFRGEALPSIASISKLKISSHRQGSAHEILIKNGTIKHIKPSPHPKGTKVEVFDLFYSTPARLKFLKSDSYENAKITNVVKKLAISYPTITFNYKNHFKLPGQNDNFDKSLKHRLFKILGEDFARNAIPINYNNHDVKLTGFIAAPTYNKNNTLSEFIFINKRPIDDKLIKSAIKAGYLDTMFHGRFPVCAIFIEVPNYFVDVNVHPSKLEVRFKNSSLIRNIIVSAIRKTLSAAGHEKIIENSAKNIQNVLSPKQPVASNQIQEKNLTATFENYKPVFASQNCHANTLTPAFSENTTETTEKEENIINSKFGIPRGQILNTYVISETKDCMFLIDMHAAHERIVYENLKSQIKNNSVKSQLMLIPEVIELTEMQKNKLNENKNQLEKLGFKLNHLSKNMISLIEIPAVLSNSNIKQIFKDVIEELEEEDITNTLENTINLVSKTAACHGSVRSGKKLSYEEMHQLLRDMEQTENISQCNHGRPTYIKLSKEEIEKLFARI